MKCGKCRKARRYAIGSMYCTLYGIIISDTHEGPGRDARTKTDMKTCQRRSRRRATYSAWEKNGRKIKKSGLTAATVSPQKGVSA